jgi:DNA-binding transcriptional regulator YhcF (GntR family)
LKLSVDKQSRVPLYLQLRDSVKYYISTGEIQSNQRLPTVNGLARELGVNFETVRKAYKELEREGLLSSKRGLGTFVIGHEVPKAALSPGNQPKSAWMDAIKQAVNQLLQLGMDPDEIKRSLEEIRAQAVLENQKRYVLFAECNTLQANEISRELRRHLPLEVRPVLIKDLPQLLKNRAKIDAQLAAVVTTGFHLNEVRASLRDHPVRIEFVITNMSPETRHKIEAFSKKSRFAFICRDAESIGLYKDTLKADLRLESDLLCCTVKEKAKLDAVLRSSDVLLVSPGAYNRVRKLAPPKLPVFNVIDRVDPVSLRIARESILGSEGPREVRALGTSEESADCRFRSPRSGPA